ncbi:MAG: hypothetical protein ACR2NU_06005 [Aeoliella sp.]
MSRLSRFVLALTMLPLAGCGPVTSSPEMEISDFSYPWAEETVPLTVFQAHTQDARLHFHFIVEDSEVIVEQEWSGESTLDREDRVEVFFAKDEALTDYWCIEIDPLGRVHDYHARHYREFDADWNCPGLQVTAKRSAKGYEVTGSLATQTLSSLLGQPVKRGTFIRIGLFRADFFGPLGATRGESATNWISWVRPTSAQPDFHIPSAFRLWEVP